MQRSIFVCFLALAGFSVPLVAQQGAPQKPLIFRQASVFVGADTDIHGSGATNPIFFSGMSGKVGHGVMVDPAMSPSSELEEIKRRRPWDPGLERPSGRLQCDLKEGSFFSQSGDQIYKLLRKGIAEAIALIPQDTLVACWGASIEAPVAGDLLIAYFKRNQEGGGVFVFALAHREAPENWQISLIPQFSGKIDENRLLDESRFGLFQIEDQVAFLAPFDFRNLAYELHLPGSLLESARFHVFPMRE